MEWKKDQRIIFVSPNGSVRGRIENISNEKIIHLVLDFPSALFNDVIATDWFYNGKTSNLRFHSKDVHTEFTLCDEHSYDEAMLKSMRRDKTITEEILGELTTNFEVGHIVHFMHDGAVNTGVVTKKDRTTLTVHFETSCVAFTKSGRYNSQHSWMFNHKGQFVGNEQAGIVLFHSLPYTAKPKASFKINDKVKYVYEGQRISGTIARLTNGGYWEVKFEEPFKAIGCNQFKDTWCFTATGHKIIANPLEQHLIDTQVLFHADTTLKEITLIKNNLTSEKEITMLSTTQRRTVRVELFDNDLGLDVSKSLVASFDNVVTEDDNTTTIQEVIMNEDIAGKLKDHNKVRTNTIDLDVLKRTGNKVMLQPVKLKDLTWVVK